MDGDFNRTIGLARRKEELDLPPDEMFRHIKRPASRSSGEFDLNVPPDHAARIVTILRNAGNHSSTCVLIPGTDHSFQLAPDDKTNASTSATASTVFVASIRRSSIKRSSSGSTTRSAQSLRPSYPPT